MFGILADVFSVLTAEYGWVLLLFAFGWELFCPLPFHETKLQTIFNELESKTENLQHENIETRDQLTDIAEQQVHLIQIVRAIARENDAIDDARVDTYLTHNGVPVYDFQENPTDEQIERDKEQFTDDD